MITPNPGPVTLVLDGHVHFHRCFDRTAFFDHAVMNFRVYAASDRPAPPPTPVLLLTEAHGDHFFDELRTAPMPIGPWRIERTREDCSAWMIRDDGASLLLIAGRQVSTGEGLEVLAIGLREEPAQGRATRETIDLVLALGGVPVVPWGFGKWWLRRGRLLDSLIRAADTPRFFLGDNSGRPQLGSDPSLFALGRERRCFVLPGSDPLPFPAQVRNVGRYGFRLSGWLDPDAPTQGVQRILRELDRQPQIFGRRETLARFVRYQVGMQLRNRGRVPR